MNDTRFEFHSFTVDEIEGEFRVDLQLKNDQPVEILLRLVPDLGDLVEPLVKHMVLTANIMLARNSLKVIAEYLGQGVCLKSGKQMSEIDLANEILAGLFGVLTAAYVPKPAEVPKEEYIPPGPQYPTPSPCPKCGRDIMLPNGTTWRCGNCGHEIARE